MTQVQTMSKATLNHELAVLMGWTEIRVLLKSDRLMGRDPVDGWATYIPDYAGDPAASLEVQTAAYAASPEWYLHHLAMRTNKEDLTPEEFPDPFEVYGPELVGPMVTADPRERAEAAYITLSQVLKSQGADQLDL